MPNEDTAGSLPAEPEAPDPGASDPIEGETPDQPQPEDSATSTLSEPAKGESVPASDAAKRSDRTNAETRIKQLDARNKASERKIAELERRLTGQGAPKETADKPKLTEPVRPNFGDFDTIGAYDAAITDYDKKAREYAVATDRQERDVARAKEEATKSQQQAMESWNKRTEETKKRNPDFDPVAAIETVSPSDTMNGFLHDSKVGPDVLDHLYQNPDDAERIRSLSPWDAARELIRIESTISDQIKGIKAKTAPRPPRLVDGAGASPVAPKSMEEVFYG